MVGHAGAVERVARVLRRNYAGFASRRPMGSFLFLGPTGVGKTELARALADVLFGTRDALVRLDMSELSESHATSRLIGAPAGYVGYEDGGQLTEAVRRRPSAVVLLDEMEKAHRDVLMLLLQLLEEGRLTDGKGRQIDFSNTVVVLTTNLGAEAFGRTRARVGFGSDSADEGGAAAALHRGAAGAAPRAVEPHRRAAGVRRPRPRGVAAHRPDAARARAAGASPRSGASPSPPATTWWTRCSTTRTSTRCSARARCARWCSAASRRRWPSTSSPARWPPAAGCACGW